MIKPFEWILLLIAAVGFREILAEFVTKILLAPFRWAWEYYYSILGYADHELGTPERKKYNRLHRDLKRPASALIIYRRLLRIALAKVDRLFGDGLDKAADRPGEASGNFGTSIFGLKKKDTYVWTAASLDRCLLYAQIYPMATVILIWAFWNNAGVPGDALFLLGRTIFQRVILPVIALFVVFGLFSSRLWSLALFFVALVLAFVIGANDGAAMAAAFLVLIAGALLLARFGVVADASEIVRTGAVTVACFVAIAVALATTGTFIGAVGNTTIVSTFCGAVAGCVGVVVAVLYAQAKRLGHRSIFLSLFIVTMIVLAYVFAARASPLASPDAWKRGGAFLLLFGLLTLLNAPFDFLSLGLTRGFLRRGLQERGFSPIKFAFYDAAVAIAIIGVLACVLVIAIQFFGALEMPGGLPHPTLNLQGALDTIEHDPWAPQNFWIYALLLTTQAPSLINLSIGAVSVAWTFRPFSTLILSGFPKTKGGRVVKADRNWMIPLLISRWFLPAVMGFIGGIFILFAIFHWLLPMIYFDIGSIVEWLVNRDFPAHLLGT